MLRKACLSIDERRASFERVKWGRPTIDKKSTPEWFEQKWLAGDHSDIGGSYPENESRLSDISLKRMLDAAVEVGMHYDTNVLQLYPDAAGMQHDETKSSIFRYFGRRFRDPSDDATLHPSVFERFREPSVLQYDVVAEYRPWCLRNHRDLQQYKFTPPAVTFWDSLWDAVWNLTNSARVQIRRLCNHAITSLRRE